MLVPFIVLILIGLVTLSVFYRLLWKVTKRDFFTQLPFIVKIIIGFLWIALVVSTVGWVVWILFLAGVI
jgi:hypothetical protein